MKTVIVAAGQGIRLREETDRIPKTLLPYGEGTILSHIMGNFAAAGVSEFVIVTGCRGELIAAYLKERRNLGHRVTLVENPAWTKGNGVSVAAARAALTPGETVLLSMSDHLVPVEGLAAVLEARSGANLLLTDPRPERIFDLDDATKVRTDGKRILDIGKEIETYDAIDCGIFRLDARFLDALDAQIARGRESISDGARVLIERGEMERVTLPGDLFWIDVDTPASYRHALENRERYLSQVSGRS